MKTANMFTNYVLCIFCEFYLISSVLCQSHNFFGRNCPLKVSEGLRKCKIYIDNFMLDFNDFRDWTSKLGETTKVMLEVSCGRNGRIFLPWPMKANGLIKLEVTGCTIEGFSSEFNKSSKLVDELEDLVLDNCVSKTSLDNIFDIIYKPVSREYDCGQESLHSVVRRNMSYSFKDSKLQKLTKHQEHLLMSSADVLTNKAKHAKYICRYPNLEHIDESTSRSRSKLYLRLMTSYSEYPKLQTFLLSDNGYTRIPREFVDWQASFPQLEYLDMSKNNIAKFNFLGTSLKGNGIRKRPLVVNLSYNTITVIPINIVDYMTATVPVIVDLTGNPLNCDCNFLRYKRYVMDVLRNYPVFSRLSAITCYSVSMGRRTRLIDYSNNNCLF